MNLGDVEPPRIVGPDALEQDVAEADDDRELALQALQQRAGIT